MMIANLLNQDRAILMKFRKPFLLAVVVFMVFTQAGQVVRAQHAERSISVVPVTVHDVQITSTADGELSFSTTGGDPFIVFMIAAEATTIQQTPVLAFEYFSTTGLEAGEVRFRKAGPWHKPIPMESLPIAEGWSSTSVSISEWLSNQPSGQKVTQVRVDFGINAGRQVSIRNLLLRKFTESEKRVAQEAEQIRQTKMLAAAQIRKRLLPEQYERRIDSVHADRNRIRIRFTAPPNNGPLRLCSFAPSANVEQVIYASSVTAVAVDSLQSSAFVELNRFQGNIDLALHRWRLFTGTTADTPVACSNLAYASRIESVQQLPPPPELSNAKGMSGVMSNGPLDELVELGICHITVNIVVTDLLHREQSRGRLPFRSEGRTWWVNERRLAGVDRTVKFATENNIVCAGIILLPTRSKDIICHPEATTHGIYAMPNFVNSDASQKYSAVLKFLASRYHGGDHGRIDHWVMHNEIDFGWTWTNMGRQPLEVFLDHYMRSMRLMWMHAIQQNAHAKVFVSLTHHWHDGKPSDWRTYRPKPILNLMAEMVAAEGDFDWGIAYHPYPQSLFKAATWNDVSVKDDFDTPLITMKNIHVLKQFLQQPHFLNSEGKLRTVLFSEQGYHAPADSEEATKVQAAAFLYTWDRLRETRFVSAFDYHRWVDHPQEGGLQLGIRSLPEAGLPFGKKKLAWGLYKDLNGPAEGRWRQRQDLPAVFDRLILPRPSSSVGR